MRLQTKADAMLEEIGLELHRSDVEAIDEVMKLGMNHPMGPLVLADFIGLGRMVLSYPEMPADVLAGKSLARKRICRTFSDCTTAPRKGLISGCYPLDEFYKLLPEAEELKDIKKAL